MPGGAHENMKTWEPEEDAVILELLDMWGPKWSRIVKALPGRTISSIRNRYQRIEKGRKLREAGLATPRHAHRVDPKRSPGQRASASLPQTKLTEEEHSTMEIDEKQRVLSRPPHTSVQQSMQVSTMRRPARPVLPTNLAIRRMVEEDIRTVRVSLPTKAPLHGLGFAALAAAASEMARRDEEEEAQAAREQADEQVPGLKDRSPLLLSRTDTVETLRCPDDTSPLSLHLVEADDDISSTTSTNRLSMHSPLSSPTVSLSCESIDTVHKYEYSLDASSLDSSSSGTPTYALDSKALSFDDSPAYQINCGSS